MAEKAIDHVDAESAPFIAASPFFLLATAAADGSCDVSPRGDPPGSVLVLDECTLAFADRKGNRRLDSFSNILERPDVGLLFLVPGTATRCGSTGPRGSWPTRPTCRGSRSPA